MFGFQFAPSGWAQCNGQTLAISQYTALFSLLGTTYGGNGTTTFQLPNLQGRLPMSQGNGAGLTPRVMGEAAGTENVSILTSNLPSHNHTLAVDGNAGGKTNPGSNFLGTVAGNATEKMYSAGPSNATMAPSAIGLTGSSIPLGILPPYLVVNFCIALQGIFPSRN